MWSSNVDNIIAVISLLAPGLIIIYIRAQFITGRVSTYGERFLSYITVSIIYTSLTAPILNAANIRTSDIETNLGLWFLYLFVGPIVSGCVLGVATQQQYFRRLLRKFGLNPVHAMPTAWDWKFASSTPQWVMLTLEDDTVFCGFIGENSFMSSDPNERDIYIEWLYERDDNDIWTSKGACGLLIPGNRIKAIEFWPHRAEGENV